MPDTQIIGSLPAENQGDRLGDQTCPSRIGGQLPQKSLPKVIRKR